MVANATVSIGPTLRLPRQLPSLDFLKQPVQILIFTCKAEQKLGLPHHVAIRQTGIMRYKYGEFTLTAALFPVKSCLLKLLPRFGLGYGNMTSA